MHRGASGQVHCGDRDGDVPWGSAYGHVEMTDLTGDDDREKAGANVQNSNINMEKSRVKKSTMKAHTTRTGLIRRMPEGCRGMKMAVHLFSKVLHMLTDMTLRIRGCARGFRIRAVFALLHRKMRRVGVTKLRVVPLT